MTNLNYYKILNISSSATSSEIKLAYRRLVKLFHPDSHSETANHEQIIKINAAYEVLSDPQRRQVYDQELFQQINQTQPESSTVYHRQKTRGMRADEQLQEWLKQVYIPVNRILEQILTPLDDEIDDLSADPFDDELLAAFQDYLETCRDLLKQAQNCFRSRQNPGNVAGVAAYLYYCLNHLGDGIEELTFFTLNYDDHYLHTGQELFRMAAGLQDEAQLSLRNFFS